MTWSTDSVEGRIAAAFIAVSGFLLLLLLITCIVCWCWRYKLHKRKRELDYNENGIITPKKKLTCRCCGCWVYCCRSCRGCCEASQKVEVKPVNVVPATDATPCGCGGGNGQRYGWSKDVHVYNTGPTTGITSTSCSQPVNFSNRWSSSNDGRLVLNGAGVVSKVIPGAQTYGGIYPSMPAGISSSNQFLLTRK